MSDYKRHWLLTRPACAVMIVVCGLNAVFCAQTAYLTWVENHANASALIVAMALNCYVLYYNVYLFRQR